MPYDPQLDPIFDAAGQQYNIDPALLKAVHLTETGGTGRWDQVSPAGARGGMQFIPGTAKMYGVNDPTDPSQAIPGAAHLLSDLLNTYEKQVGPGQEALTMALRGYNGGGPSRWNNPETASYPGAVAKYYAQVAGPAAPAAAAQQAPNPGDYTPDEQAYWQHNQANPRSAVTWDQWQKQRGSPMDNGVAALAAAGQLPAAQAPQGGMSDEDLLNGWVNQSLPFLPKAPEPIAVPPQGAQSAPMATPGPGAAPGAPASPSAPALDVQGFVDTYNKMRTFPAGVPLANTALQAVMKMAPEGYILHTDGSLIPRPGGPADPAQAQRLKGAEAEGAEGPKRITAAVAPYNETPGLTRINPLMPPPASPTTTASGLTASAAPGGGTAVSGGPPTEVVGEYNKTLAEMAKEADAARSAQFQAKALKERLHDIGTSGPLTEGLGRLSALGQQLIPGFDPKQINLPNGATVEQANALALNLLGDVLKSQFPQRITNTDIAVFKPSAANPNMLSEATDYLIDRVALPKLQRSIDRYGAAVNADLPQQTPQHLQRFLNHWDNENPYEKFAPPPAAAKQQFTPAEIEAEMRRRKLIQ